MLQTANTYVPGMYQVCIHHAHIIIIIIIDQQQLYTSSKQPSTALLCMISQSNAHNKHIRHIINTCHTTNSKYVYVWYLVINTSTLRTYVYGQTPSQLGPWRMYSIPGMIVVRVRIRTWYLVGTRSVDQLLLLVLLLLLGAACCVCLL